MRQNQLSDLVKKVQLKSITTSGNYWFYACMVILSAVYIFFPSNNPLQDSWSYAGSVKYGVDLFYAHHLLYTPLNRAIYTAIHPVFSTIDALRLMQFINALFALGCLFLLRSILIKLTKNTANAHLWTFFTGCSFGIMRFSAEAEVYVIPIFLSLLSSAFLLRYLKDGRGRNALLSGGFATLACLFHQIHLFWGIGLFFGFLFSKKPGSALLYLIPTPLVLLAYSLVLVYDQQVAFSAEHLMQFLAQYYYTPNAEAHIGVNNIIISLITFVRTFFQIHGIIPEIFKWLPQACFSAFIVATLLIIAGIGFIKSIKIRWNRQSGIFERTHLLIFVLQFGFAFFSQGNSEFMVMLPFLIAIFIDMFILFQPKILLPAAFAMLIWNFTFAIYPNHYFDYQNNKALISVINKNPDKIFILKERGIVANLYFYYYGTDESNRVLGDENLEQINALKKQKHVFYTDLLTRKTPYNRVDFTTKQQLNNLIFVKHIAKIHSAMGGFYIDEVKCADK